MIRRVPEKNKQKLAAGQDTIFDTYRHHGFFTTISPRSSIPLLLTGCTAVMR